ncbi:hypothetical protein [Nocardia sp. NPDC057227]|uniref:hypothetical protein n=1 Tax=Nocardia sp. NPDC057227 TaxID=3346056 RepID=UPI003642888B
MADPGFLSIEESGAVSWFSARAAAVPPVEFAVAPGILVQVDPARPSDPLGWSIDGGTSAEPLASALGSPEFAPFVTELRGRGAGVYAFTAPGLTGAWPHRAVVAATARWTVRPLHRGALLLDRAVAAHGVGGTAEARRLFGHADYALRELGERCVRGELGDSAGQLVRTAFAAAGTAGIGAELADLAEQVAATAAVGDAELLATLAAWVDAAARTRPDILVGDDAARLSRDREPLDLTVLPPRILAWAGRNTAELRLEYHADSDSLLLEAPLADGVDPLCREARELLGYSAELRTGTVVAVAPAVAAGRSVVAWIPARDRDPATLTLGLFDAGADLGTLRTDPMGRALAAVDRATIEAWNEQRRATALLSVAVQTDHQAGERARLRSDEHLVAARAATADARRLLATLIGAAGDEAEELTARASAVDAYADRLWEVGPVPVSELLLVDLIPPNADPD